VIAPERERRGRWLVPYADGRRATLLDQEWMIEMDLARERERLRRRRIRPWRIAGTNRARGLD
jgi:hypothetical protein